MNFGLHFTPLMKVLLDFVPILLFGAYKLYGIYVGTGVLMAATVAQMGITYALERRLSNHAKVTLVLVPGLWHANPRVHRTHEASSSGSQPSCTLHSWRWLQQTRVFEELPQTILLGGQLALPDAVAPAQRPG